jgi:hypothetical protein
MRIYLIDLLGGGRDGLGRAGKCICDGDFVRGLLWGEHVMVVVVVIVGLL